ncbi:MAG: DUF6655 family protein [Planctomycetia bacterium]
MTYSQLLKRLLLLSMGICLVPMAGCGTAVQRQGTEQLLLSDSVDRAIDQLDLSGLANRKVFLDTEYMKTFKGSNIYINSDYIISALRQKMTTSGLQIELNRTEADYILEARVGALGTDTMEVTYGIPSSNGVGAAATALSGVPAVPLIPEMSFGKRNGVVGISKVVVYAYHRDTGVPVWQSGSAVARSDARDSWMLGVGPLFQGSVYGGTLLAGNRVNPPFEKKDARKQKPKPMTIADRQQYVHPAVLERQLADAKSGKSTLDGGVEQAAHEQPAGAAGGTGAAAPAPATPVPPTPAPVPPAPATPVPPQPVLPPATGAGVVPAAVEAPKAVPALPAEPPLVPPATK